MDIGELWKLRSDFLESIEQGVKDGEIDSTIKMTISHITDIFLRWAERNQGK